MSKPSLTWVRRARGASRFSVPHKLMLDGKEIGEFYQHEELESRLADEQAKRVAAEKEIASYLEERVWQT